MRLAKVEFNRQPIVAAEDREIFLSSFILSDGRLDNEGALSGY